MNLYLLGGRQKSRLLRPVAAERRFETGIILRLDTEAGTTENLVCYRSPAEAKAHQESSNLFASGTISGNRLYACTYTEVLGFDVPSFQPTAYISLPRFNALHHVCCTKRGTLLIANTGLDMVVELDLKGTVLRQWSVLGDNPWGRFSENCDYRKIASTKPHQSHPNFVFEIENDVWVTRFRQRDAICLTDRTKRIDIKIERPHDGSLHDELLYFTTVDGHIVVVDTKSLTTVSVIDLKQFRDYRYRGAAWCRGLLITANSSQVWVGFTRIRKTLLMQGANWIRKGFRSVEPPTHIALFDLAAERCLKVIDLEPHGINILFSILPA